MKRKWFNTYDGRDGEPVTFDANCVVGASVQTYILERGNERFWKITLVLGQSVPIATSEFDRLKKLIGYPFGEFDSK